ncbi:hypothetical protein CRUP_030619, partial [Coryphaenoides rupestris]
VEKGKPGSPGPPGPPGRSGLVDQLEIQVSPGVLGLDSQVRSYKTLQVLARESEGASEGSLAFVSEHGELYLRTLAGWRALQELQESSRAYQPSYKLLPQTWTTGPGLHLVALNSPLRGDLGGVRGADLQCYEEAQAEGLTSSYRAFLSSHLQDLATVVRRADRQHLPVVNLQGEVLFSSWASIFSGDGGVFNPATPLYSFDGRDGEVLFSSWASIFSGDGGVFNPATPLYSFDGRDVMTDPACRSCSAPLVVLCIENTYVANAPPRGGATAEGAWPLQRGRG